MAVFSDPAQDGFSVNGGNAFTELLFGIRQRWAAAMSCGHMYSSWNRFTASFWDGVISGYEMTGHDTAPCPIGGYPAPDTVYNLNGPWNNDPSRPWPYGHSVNPDVWKRPLLRKMQDTLEGTAASGVWLRDAEVVGDEETLPTYNLASWREAAGLNEDGFRRVATWDGVSAPTFEYGPIQDGDIFGYWIWEDLVAGMKALKWTASTTIVVGGGEGKLASASGYYDWPTAQSNFHSNWLAASPYSPGLGHVPFATGRSVSIWDNQRRVARYYMSANYMRSKWSFFVKDPGGDMDFPECDGWDYLTAYSGYPFEAIPSVGGTENTYNQFWDNVAITSWSNFGGSVPTVTSSSLYEWTPGTYGPVTDYDIDSDPGPATSQNTPVGPDLGCKYSKARLIIKWIFRNS
jgi:hypothetical protein